MYKIGKVKLPHRKSTAEMPGFRMNPPGEIFLPMVQHIGASAKPIVKAGDEVYVGTTVAEAGGFVSANIHSSVSGKVKKIDKFVQSNGSVCEAIVIESDGKMELDPSIKAPVVNSFEDLSNAARAAGLVGLGGAGFPTAVKLDPKRIDSIDTLVLNGAECEPYITSDTRVMLERADDIKDGVEKILSLTNISRVVIGIEENKKSCIEKLSEVFSSNEKVDVMSLPDKYPQGGEKILIFNTLGRIVPEGGLPADVGVIVMNVTTVATLAKYLKDGIPLVEKLVTVDGSSIANPCNIIAPIGTPISALIEAAGGLSDEPCKMLLGGPMMGIAVYTEKTPIMKNTNAVTVLNEKDAKNPKETACIHCGRCVSACPMNLDPTSFTKAMALIDRDARIDILRDEHASLCMECGCCSFVCPARRPLVEHNRLAKADLRAYEAEKKKKS